MSTGNLNTQGDHSSWGLRGARGTVFWRVASIQVGALVAAVLLSVLLSAWLALDRSVDLVSSSLQLRLDSVAEEIESRGEPENGFDGMPIGLLIDLASRFQDPVYLFDLNQEMRQISAEGDLLSDPSSVELPGPIRISVFDAMDLDTLVIEIDRSHPENGFAFAPIYDAAGLPAGGLLVSPLSETVSAELSGPRDAYVRTLWIVTIVALVVALALGSYLTWIMVRPLRGIADSIAAIGGGEYSNRLVPASNDEFGRLAGSVNKMAESVESSIEALRGADQTRRQMVANMGHDLRTPLAAMLGYLEEAQRYAESNQHQKAAEALTTAKSQGSRLRQLIDDLFELSLLDSIPPAIRYEPVPLGELVSEVAGIHRPLFKQEVIRFEVELESGLPTILGDGIRLLRLLNNLLSNAREHTGHGDAVVLKCCRLSHGVEIQVTDTGAGIASGDLETIFDRHVHGKSARTRKSSGTGLGLAISKAIAHAHGGELEVKSRKGEGTSFKLFLPLEAALDGKGPERFANGAM